jgi:hypothetical protein
MQTPDELLNQVERAQRKAADAGGRILVMGEVQSGVASNNQPREQVQARAPLRDVCADPHGG